MVEKKEEKQDKYVAAEVPTQFGVAIVDQKENKVYTIEQALAKIMSDLEELKKLLN